ncbi:MAG: zinc ABC transporter substrate-binding protein [Phycisphaerae bacterium]|nr:zinc ABC transporter substrate-binding protein [Phycisphaerae bacterium]
MSVATCVARSMLLALAAAALIGCGDSSPSPNASSGATGTAARPTVVVTSLPLLAMVHEISAGDVEIVFPVPEEVDPPFWVPTAEDVGRMQGADLIVTNGAGYERWLPTVSVPRTRVVDTNAANADQLIELAEDVTHSHGPAGAHSHRGTAFTTWIDFALASRQARAIADALAERVPHYAQDATASARMRERARELSERLDSLAAQTVLAGRELNGAPIIASHPVYEYLSRRAGLNTRSVHWEPGEAPTPEQWRELDAMRETHRASLMLWEGAPLPETEKLLADRGVRCVVFAPLGNSDNRDAAAWLDAMAANVARLRAAAHPPADESHR